MVTCLAVSSCKTIRTIAALASSCISTRCIIHTRVFTVVRLV